MEQEHSLAPVQAKLHDGVKVPTPVFVSLFCFNPLFAFVLWAGTL
jgi:hypothetical protein